MEKKTKVLIICGAVVAAIAVIYIGLSVYFMNHFYFGSKISGVNVSGASLDRAKEKVQQGMDNYELVITERDGTTDIILGSEMGLLVEWNGSLEECLAAQKGFDWIYKLFVPETYDEVCKLSYDKAALEKAIDSSSCMAEEKQVMPQNATVSEYSLETGYTLVPSVPGTAIDKEKLMLEVGKCIKNLNKDLNLEECGAYYQPEIGDEDEKLLATIAQLNKCLSTVVTYQVGSSTQVLNASVFQPWLYVNDALEVCINDESLTAYVKALASTYNTCYSPKKLMTSYGKEVTISNSHYGWKVNNDVEKAAIIANIMAGDVITRDLNYSMVANSHDGNDYGNSYVEINLTAQHLFLYVNGQLIIESDLVSGNLAKGYNSPTGAYGVTYKEKNATLNGADYSTPVDYWMPFAGNVGMHDATWRGSFGGSIYKRNGSHGCINLPWSAAKTIFSYVDAGFPVLVYNLAGTQSAKGVAQDQAYVVVDLIKAIGPVTLNSEPAILNARAKYNALSATAKKYVSNYQVLVDAEKTLAKLKEQIIVDPLVPSSKY